MNRQQKVLLAAVFGYIAISVGLYATKMRPAPLLEGLLALRILCLLSIVALAMFQLRSLQVSKIAATVMGTATLLVLADICLLVAALDKSLQQSAWIGIPFALSTYLGFMLIACGISAALEGTRFAKPLWKSSRTSENLMWWHRRD